MKKLFEVVCTEASVWCIYYLEQC